MSKYLISGSYTAEGAKGVLKDGGSKRRSVAKGLVEKAGGKLEAFYFAFGNTDFFLICDLPDAATAAAVTLTVGASGAIQCHTTVLVTPEEIDAASKKSVDYHAPGK